jgi:hypothetical protein
LTFKYDLGGRDPCFAPDISSYYRDYLYKVFLKSLDLWKKVWTGHKIYTLTDYVNLLPLSVTLTLEVGTQVLRMTYYLITVTICAKNIQNPLIYEEVMYGTQTIYIIHITDSLNIWPLSVTLTLEVGVQVLYLTYPLIIMTICAKLFQNQEKF